MSKKTKRFFVLKNIKSQFVEQAFFVPREKGLGEDGDSDIIIEAERIINHYLKKMGYRTIGSRKRSSPLFVMSIAAAAVVAVFAAIRVFA